MCIYTHTRLLYEPAIYLTVNDRAALFVIIQFTYSLDEYILAIL